MDGRGLYPNSILTKYPKTEFLNPKKPSKRFKIDTNFDNTNKKYTGPIHIGPPTLYGITMSKKLMLDLGLNDEDVVYFKLTQ